MSIKFVKPNKKVFQENNSIMMYQIATYSTSNIHEMRIISVDGNFHITNVQTVHLSKDEIKNMTQGLNTNQTLFYPVYCLKQISLPRLNEIQMVYSPLLR